MIEQINAPCEFNKFAGGFYLFLFCFPFLLDIESIKREVCMKKFLAGFLSLGLLGSAVVIIVSKWLQERLKKI